MYQDAKVVLINENVTPHSVFGFIFIYSKDYLEGNIDARILHHDLSHVRQRHSFDILFIGFLQVFFWFNPELIFIKRAFQLNHEFLADQAVVDEFGDGHSYQSMLVHELGKSVSPPLTSSSNYLVTRKRLTMITKSSSFVSTLFRKVAVVPVFVLALVLFSSKISATTLDVSLDTAISRLLERNLPFPESLKAGETGHVLLRLIKSGQELTIKVLYTSYKNYPAGVDENLTKSINKRGLAVKFNQDEMIVPVVYQYIDEQHQTGAVTISGEEKKIIAELGREIEVSKPVIMVDYPKK